MNIRRVGLTRPTGKEAHMPYRFIMFVDGSNLFGVAKHLSIQFDDYEKLYRYLFKKCTDDWRHSFVGEETLSAQLTRVYWYTVGSIDEWDLASPQAQQHLKRQFELDREVRPNWLKLAGQALREAGKPHDQQRIADAAWTLCFEDFRDWYSKKKSILDGMQRFHFAIEAQTDFIEVRRVGHWKVDFLHKSLEEKRLDTSFAVDMVAMMSAYDVALLISGDADGIPSVNHAKNSGRHVGAVEFLKGYPPENRSKNLSAKLKIAADFVTPIYEMDLVRDGVGSKGTS
jgi:uncharacterized LabA/DUF88 family protein